FILCLASVTLFAVDLDYQDLIDKTRRYLNVYPEDDAERLNLAYYYMMASDPKLALEQYRLLETKDAYASAAGEGILWALNSLGMYRQSIAKADSLITAYPTMHGYHIYKGQAELRLSYPLKARRSYLHALKDDNRDAVIRSNARDGLAWSYLALQDYAGAINAIKAQYTDTSLSDAQKEINRIHTFTSAAFSYKESGNYGISANLGTQKGTWAIGASFHQQFVDAAKYRYSIGARINKQTKPMDFSLRFAHLSGDDERVYPGNSASLKTTGKLYLADFLIKPATTIHLSSYARHNAYQGDLGIKISRDKLSLGFGISRIYQDREAIEADSLSYTHNLSVGFVPLPFLNLGLHLIKGNSAWWIDAEGSIYDDFDAPSTIYGISANLYLSKHLGLSLYQHIGIENDENSYYTFASLTLRS
ncbi:MAG: hypothetical protein U1B83_05140, partial [Candidatus Cloacimonadaceae bacterium]|nr:hypothetical protein [Candidatus Cloacimonadaceae bacterium]